MNTRNQFVGKPRRWTQVITLAALSLVLTGCLLRSISGLVIVDDLGQFIDLIFADVDAAYCREVRDFETDTTTVECQYNIVTEDGSSQRTSTAELISEFGVFGVIVDPVILQVPEIATINVAAVDDGSGVQPLVVTETTSFDVQPGVQASAEPGHKFWILDLPTSIEATLPTSPTNTPPQLDYQLSYRLPGVFSTDPVKLKALFAGRVEAAGQTYYFPLFPCTTNFADVPEFSLPVNVPLNGFIFALLNAYFDGGDLVCDNQVYDFTPIAVEPMACDADLDRDVDRADIAAVFGRRNTPALLDDPLDADADGTITVLDARQCTLACTRPRCALN